MITISDKIDIINNRLADLERSTSTILNLDQEGLEWYENLNQEDKNKVTTFISNQNAKMSKLNDILTNLRNGIDQIG
jgi:hypothetical protein